MRLATAVAALALLAGCTELQQLGNHKVLAGAVLNSPSLSAGPVTLGDATTAQVFFGERKDDLSQAPTGLTGATVVLTWDGNATGVTLSPGPQGAGWYQTSSGITYTEGATYRVKVTYQGEDFTASVQAPTRPKIENATLFLLPPVSYASGTVTITRVGTSDAFYAVFRTTSNPSDMANATCTNAPVNDAGALVTYILGDDTPYKATSFTLPKSPCFPSNDAYVVTLTAVAKSTSTSTNLFTGSALLAGAADAAVQTFTP
jgi:hypothetical protein